MKGVQAFVERYGEAWDAVLGGDASTASLDPFFYLPCYMIGADGAASVHGDAQSLETFHDARLASFRAAGVAHRELTDIRIQSQGAHLALAIVDWTGRRADGSRQRAWRQYYTLLTDDGAPKFLVSGFRSDEDVSRDASRGIEDLIRYRSTG